MALPLLPLLGGLLRGGAALAGRAGSSMLGSFGLRSAATSIPFRGLGASMAKDLGGQSLFAQLAARQLGGLSNHQRFDMSALARRLGTPVPSQQQVDAEKKRIQQHNQDNSLNSSLMRSTGRLTAFTTGLATATGGLNRLARSANDNAIEGLRRYNPQLAAEAVRRERFEDRFQIARGRMVSGSTLRLSQATMRNREEWQPYAAATENFKNNIGTLAVNISTAFEGVLESIGLTAALRRYNESQREKDPQLDPLMHVIRSSLNMPTKVTPLNQRPAKSGLIVDQGDQGGIGSMGNAINF